jgi:GAF domain-containing protein
VRTVTSTDWPTDELVGAFARMSGFLLTEQTVDAALVTVTSLATETIEHSDGAGVTLLDAQGHRATSAATDPLVGRLDELQYRLDEGPCLTAWRDLAVVRSGDDDAQRWPTWTPLAHELGMRSFLSVPLLAGDVAVGALKVYSRSPAAFDERDEHLLHRFAAQAAVFVANVKALRDAEHFTDHLKETLRTRDLLATARGILMAQNRIGPEAAFVELAALAERDGTTVAVVAQRLVDAIGG